MLFAEEVVNPWVSAGAAGGIVTVLAFLFRWAERWLDRRDKRQKAGEEREDHEEETALTRLKAVMDLREADCDRRIADLSHRVDVLEQGKGQWQVERDAMRDKLAMYAARVKYLEFCCRAGIKPDDWDKPDTAPGGLPAVDAGHKGDQP